MDRRVAYLVLILTFSLILVAQASAFGISQTYFENKTIPMEPGSHYPLKIRLQNTDDMYVKTTVSLQGPFASFNGNPNMTVMIPPMSRDNYYFINISVPVNASIGEEYKHIWVVSPSPEVEGQVSMAIRIREQFIVKVVRGSGFFDRITGAVTDGASSLWSFSKSTPVVVSFLIIVVVAFLIVTYRQGSIASKLFFGKLEKKSQTVNDSFSLPDNLADIALYLYENKIMVDEGLRMSIARKVHEVTGSPELAYRIYDAKDREDIINVLLSMKT